MSTILMSIIKKSFVCFLSKIYFFCNRFIKKWFDKKDFFTLMVIPHAPVKNIKSVKFSKRAFSLLLIFNIIMLAAACIFFFSYVSINAMLYNTKTEYESLKTVKKHTEEKLNEFKANEKEIIDRIQLLKELESKLRNIIEYRDNNRQSSSSSLPRLAGRGSFNITQRPVTTTVKEEDFNSLQDIFKAIDYTALQIEGDIKELNIANLKADISDSVMRSIPSVLPTYGQITSNFGYRQNPFGSGYEFHPAIDIANSWGTPIRASGDGLVTLAGWETGYGILVEINHQNGYESLYGHNSKLTVRVGQKVKRGQIISYMGDTGRATGTHCHYEVRLYGRPINPVTENN